MQNLFKIFSLFFVSITLTVSSLAQSISKEPILDDKYYGLTIYELSDGRVCFYYQDPQYRAIVKSISFCLENKQQALELMSEALRVLDLPKTGKSQNIEHKVGSIDLRRSGSLQKWVYIDEGLSLNEKGLRRAVVALESYQYSNERNID